MHLNYVNNKYIVCMGVGSKKKMWVGHLQSMVGHPSDFFFFTVVPNTLSNLYAKISL